MGHQTVPQRYLKHFESPERPDCIWMFDKLKRTSAHLPIKVVAQSPAFYEPTVEMALATLVEKPANIVIERILRGEIRDESIDIADRTVLSYYIASMIRRVPKSRKRDEQFVPGAIADAARKTRARVHRDVENGRTDIDSLPELLACIDAWEKRELSKTPRQVREIIETPWPFESMFTVVHNMYWRILRRSGASAFITSDNPAS